MLFNLIKQLKIGGRLIAPVHDKENNSDKQHIWIYDKISEEKIIKKKGPPLSYVDIKTHKEQIKKGIFNIFENNKNFLKKIKKNKISKKYLKRLILS